MNIESSPTPKGNRFKITMAFAGLAALCAAILFYQTQDKNHANTKKEILVVLPLSGKGASHGEYIREGLKMYAKHHPDSQLHVTIVDSESDPKKAVSAFQQQLLLKKPVAAISILSGVSANIAPNAQDNDLLLVGINTAPASFVDDFTITQRINDRPSDHTAPLAKMAARKFDAVGVLYANDAFGQFCLTTFKESYKKDNSHEVIAEPFNPTEPDQNLVVQRLLAKNPDAIFVAGYGQGYITIFQTLRTFSYKKPIFADINLSNPTVLAALGDAADGIVFAAMGFNVSPPSTEKAARFLAEYQSEFQREPWLGSAFVYDTMAIFDHLAKTGKPFTRQSIYELKKFDGIAAPLSFPSPGECQYIFSFVKRGGGKNVPVALDQLSH